ncbi:uncharacterized protein LOC135823549 [Sycon ciliatum]|uniref:uncharacterized protein LOC135823549 n=1 Tax=Sycon ciliatum TaxID=27933 RepID=UPI0031F67EDF
MQKAARILRAAHASVLNEGYFKCIASNGIGNPVVKVIRVAITNATVPVVNSTIAQPSFATGSLEAPAGKVRPGDTVYKVRRGHPVGKSNPGDTVDVVRSVGKVRPGDNVYKVRPGRPVGKVSPGDTVHAVRLRRPVHPANSKRTPMLSVPQPDFNSSEDATVLVFNTTDDAANNGNTPMQDDPWFQFSASKGSGESPKKPDHGATFAVIGGVLGGLILICAVLVAYHQRSRRYPDVEIRPERPSYGAAKSSGPVKANPFSTKLMPVPSLESCTEIPNQPGLLFGVNGIFMSPDIFASHYLMA